VRSVAEREDALLGPRLFLVAPRAAESRIEAVLLERLAQRQRLHYVRMHARSMRQWADTVTHPVFVDVDQEVETEFIRHPVTKCDHLAEFPRRIHMQKWERRLCRIERLHGQVQKHRGILADRIQHHRLSEICRDLPHNVDRLGFQPLEVRMYFSHAKGVSRQFVYMSGVNMRKGLLSRSPEPSLSLDLSG